MCDDAPIAVLCQIVISKRFFFFVPLTTFRLFKKFKAKLSEVWKILLTYLSLCSLHDFIKAYERKILIFSVRRDCDIMNLIKNRF